VVATDATREQPEEQSPTVDSSDAGESVRPLESWRVRSPPHPHHHHRYQRRRRCHALGPNAFGCHSIVLDPTVFRRCQRGDSEDCDDKVDGILGTI
jgi:hypothetical protein